VQVALWAITFAVFIVAGILVVRGKDWWRALAGFVLAGVVFQVLTLGQPPAPVSLTLVWLVAVVLWWPTQSSGGRVAAAAIPLHPMRVSAD